MRHEPPRLGVAAVRSCLRAVRRLERAAAEARRPDLARSQRSAERGSVLGVRTKRTHDPIQRRAGLWPGGETLTSGVFMAVLVVIALVLATVAVALTSAVVGRSGTRRRPEGRSRLRPGANSFLRHSGRSRTDRVASVDRSSSQCAPGEGARMPALECHGPTPVGRMDSVTLLGSGRADWLVDWPGILSFA
jgi:hypothetical protein